MTEYAYGYIHTLEEAMSQMIVQLGNDVDVKTKMLIDMNTSCCRTPLYPLFDPVMNKIFLEELYKKATKKN